MEDSFSFLSLPWRPSVGIIACWFPSAAQKLQTYLNPHLGAFSNLRNNYKWYLSRWNLRFRWVRNKVKRVLNNNVYPSSAPTPIQYQWSSGNKLRTFSNISPKDKVVSFPAFYHQKRGKSLSHTGKRKEFIAANKCIDETEMRQRNWMTLSQESPRNSFTEAAPWAYIIGETQ